MVYQPEYDDDKTVVETSKKKPGTPPFMAVATPGQGSMVGELYVAQQSSITNYVQGANPLLEAAAPLIVEMITIKNGACEELESLRNRLESAMRAFEIKVLSGNLDRSQVMAARYLLCTALDESVSTSAAGESGEWSRHALLSTFHNETWGGEKFFQVLEKCMQQPAQSLYLLELMYVLISLGFEGRYRVMDRGVIALEALRDKVFKQIRLLRGDPGPDLSARIEKPKTFNRIHRYIPLWLVLLGSFLGLTVSFFAFLFALNTRADSVFNDYKSFSISADNKGGTDAVNIK